MQKLQSRNPQFAVFTNPARAGQTWTLTIAGHAAHPAVACRSLVQKGGGFFVETRIACAASKEECDKLEVGFKQVDAEMSAALAKQRK